MLIVQVSVKVKSEYVNDFISLTQENAMNSVHEQGIARFDVLQQIDDPTQFVLIEAYRHENAPQEHKQTEHYKKWKEGVEKMMAIPRSSIKYNAVFPGDGNW